MLPKVEHPHDLAFADRLLAGAEAAAGRTTPVRLVALIETAAGLAAAAEIARASERLDGLVIGYADLAASLGRPSAGAAETWRFAQESVLVAARAAGIQAIDGPYLGTRDDDAFRASAAHARALGYDGKWAIHPAQLDALRETFTPTEEEVADAREVLAALERAAADGAGAVAADGQMLDEALALSARRVLARAGGAMSVASARRCRRPSERRMTLAVDTRPPPWFEDLPVGTVFGGAPSLTLTEGHAALHQAITGDRLRLALDHTLGEATVGAGPPVAHPGLVWDTAIGQSTVATGRVVANLFYRGLLLRRAVRLGDTLHTTTEVVARRENRVKEGRRPTGLALLRIRTVDQAQRPVLDFTRCAMLPLRDDPTGEPGDEVGGAADLEAEPLLAAAEGLDLAAYRAAVPGPHFDAVPDGWAVEIEGGDVVDSAPALARLTLNAAMAHLDSGSTADGRRLVYGGHAIGLAAGQAARALPALVTILGWHSCEHTAPVFEGDTLRSRIALERREPLPGGGGLLHLRSRVTAARADGGEDAEVLDWRFVAVLA